MKSFQKIYILCVVALIVNGQLIFAQPGVIKQEELSEFLLQSSAVVLQNGTEISMTGYRSNIYWHPVKVPSTVLFGLVSNKIYPDPYTGMNNMLIPDASDEFNAQYGLERYSHLPNDPNPWKKPYWYRTSFFVPNTDKGRHFQLIFKGINYRAEVWLNGQIIADSSEMVGMFAEYFLPVDDQIRAGSENSLAVKIYPLDVPGLPSPEQLKALDDFYPNGGPTGDIGKNVTMLCSVGWDWIPPVRDRNMGIWQPVFLRTSDHVTIHRPHVKTDLPNLPEAEVAQISIAAELENNSAQRVFGKLLVTIKPENFMGSPISFSKEISIDAKSTLQMVLDHQEIDQLTIAHPQLWWPNGYGDPNLYRLDLEYEISGVASDRQSVIFGIRTIDTKIEQDPGEFARRSFFVNGKRVFLQGGAWVPDMLLNRDSTRYASELRLCRNAHVNLVRIWGGGITPPDIFFELADRLGLLVWSDFWITGDTQGEFKGSPDWPIEGEVFKNNVISTIYRIRNHPSLLLWTGGNEGHARKELYDVMRNSIITLDGTRPFIPSSSGFANLPEGWEGSWPDGGPAGVYSSGPYQWRDPLEYFEKSDQGKDWVFKDETGIPSQPTYNSLVKMFPNLIWDKNAPFPLNDTWGYHDAATGNGRYDRYYDDMVRQFGKPQSIEDFSNKMQLMNAMGYQAIFEGPSHLLHKTGGVMLWKLNAAFPSVIWQIYDWYLQPNAGYYFMQNACEPVHIQFNRHHAKIGVVNRMHEDFSNLEVNVQLFDFKSKLLFEDQATINVGADQAVESIDLSEVIKNNSGLKLLVLNLRDVEQTNISHNVYWLEDANDFTNLSQMPKTKVTAVVENLQQISGEKEVTIRFSNNTGQLAFFIRPQIMLSDEEILPSYWSASYFSLAPGESITTKVRYEDKTTMGKIPILKVSAWNMDIVEAALP